MSDTRDELESGHVLYVTSVYVVTNDGAQINVKRDGLGMDSIRQTSTHSHHGGWYA